MILGESILFAQDSLLFFGQRRKISLPTWTEVDMPTPKASQCGLRLLVVVGAKLTILAIVCHGAPQLFVFQESFDVGLEVLGLSGWSIALDVRTVARDEELCKIPFDVAVLLHALADGLEEHGCALGLQTMVLLGRHLLLEILEDRLCSGAVDIGLLHDLERHPIVELTEFLNLAVTAGILLLELVTGEANDDETLITILLIEFFKAGKLRRKATLAGRIDDEEHFPAKLFKIQFLALAREGFEVVDCCHSFCVYLIILLLLYVLL